MPIDDRQDANEYLDDLHARLLDGDEPYVDRHDARDSFQELGADDWLDAIDQGLVPVEEAAYLYAAGIDSPYEQHDVTLSHDGGGWELAIDGEVVWESDGDDVPSWIWDELYDLADDLDWGWDVEYEDTK